MAARLEVRLPEIMELRQVSASDLDPLLDEEIVRWREILDWDFRPSAELVRRFVGIQALGGYALCYGSKVIGYSYFVCEERKGLIGDLFVRADIAMAEHEYRLLLAVLDELMRTPGVRRIESQLMMMRGGWRRPMPHAATLRTHLRNFMVCDLSGVSALAPAAGEARMRFETWNENRQEEAAQLIANSYRGHVDSDINDQYRSTSGARKFLMNIVQYPGCGSFYAPASYLAFQQTGGRIGGVCLSSLVSSDTGHITQVCVLPALRGMGVGYEMLRRALCSLRDHPCRTASLTVTSSNRHAIELYESMGFHTDRQFAAHVWEGF